jgi:antitoxin Phd
VFLTIDTHNSVPLTEANQNFSKAIKLVEENGMAAILENNKPRYMVLNYSEYVELQDIRRIYINEIANNVIAENLEALTELAK